VVVPSKVLSVTGLTKQRTVLEYPRIMHRPRPACLDDWEHQVMITDGLEDDAVLLLAIGVAVGGTSRGRGMVIWVPSLAINGTHNSGKASLLIKVSGNGNASSPVGTDVYISK
jgi:hypothetical protein